MKKKNKWIVLFIIILIIALCLVGGLAYWFTNYYPKYKAGRDISMLLKQVLMEENQSMQLKLEAEIGKERIELDADVCVISQDETKYIILKKDDYVFYVVDGVLYLESGKAYKLMEEVDFFAPLASVYELLEVEERKEGIDTVYAVTAKKEQAKELLLSIAPAEAQKLDAIEQICLELSEREDKLNAIAMTGEVAFDEQDIQFDMELSKFRVLGEDAYEIPATVKNAVAMVDKDSLFSLTKDLYRLLLAVYDMSDREELNGTVEISAHCGEIDFEKQYPLENLKAEISDIANSEEIEKMPLMIAALCMEGDATCTQTQGSYVYELQLKEEEIKSLAQSIAPEIVNRIVSLSNGKAIMTLKDGQVTSMDILIEGKVMVLFVEFDAEIGAKFIFTNEK